MEQKKEYIKRLRNMVEDGIVSEKDILKYFPEAAYNAEWSEEDEEMCYKVTAVINKLCAEGKEYVWSVNTLNKLFYWLKSLKGRVQPKQEWSEEDKIHYNKCLQYLESISPRKEDIEWFKSLRPQKPTEEQINDTDKNEHIPKFLVGDWVVQDGVGTYKVVEICESWYEVVSKDGIQRTISFSQESKCRLWDIKIDAATGNCIVDKDGYIGLFKKISDGRFFWHSFIYIDDNGELSYGGGAHDCFMSQPATEAERKKLTDAMTKNGYVLSVVDNKVYKTDEYLNE